MHLATSKTMRDADGEAIHVLGIPSTLLMTNAAQKVALAAMDYTANRKSAVCLCGSGNNGGDGVAAAICLMRHGIDVKCFLVGDRRKMTQDLSEMERRLVELGGVLESFDREAVKTALSKADVAVDAIFGIGLSRPVEGKALEAVRLLNDSGVPVVSADIASGVEADTGRILGEAVKAAVTVTFTLPKPGHFSEPGCVCCGRLVVSDIGIPAQVARKAQTEISVVDKSELSLPKRAEISHKGDYGKLLVIGGSVGYTGAPVMCANAAARAGAGLVFLGVPESIYPIVAGKVTEPMPFPLEDGKTGGLCENAADTAERKLSSCDAMVIGCGLGRAEETSALVRDLVSHSEKQLVIDADGLYALGNDPENIKSAKLPPVLTPHEGEFLRLGGVLTGNRIADAASFAKSRNCILVLKGHRTVCAFPDGQTFIIPYGNPGMAKGGSGDVLAGIIGAFAVQMDIRKAVVTACAVHALAGDCCAERYGEYSMLPTDIIAMLPEITKEIISQN